MLKKLITVILLLSLMSSVSVMAENLNTAEETVPEVSKEMPFKGGERPQGGRGGMGMPQSGDMQGRGTPPEMPNGEMPSGDFAPPQNAGEFIPPQNAGEFTPPQGNESSNAEITAPQADTGVAEENQQMPENSEESGQTQSGNVLFGGQMPEGMGRFSGNMQNGQNTATEQPTGFLGFVKTYSTPITSVILLALAFIFVTFYRRKNY
ncbi:MAG: hypothetical protein IKW64_04940 [Clostridia bacterium]|nr:hypothetical protein [Clostridia bacterium]